MQQNYDNSKKSTTQYSHHKKQPPIDYYLQKISLIKNDHPLHLTTFHREPNIKTVTDFTSSFSDLKKHQLSLSSNKKDYQKKRTFSTKTQFNFTPNPKTSQLKTKTQYASKIFQLGQQKMYSKFSVSDQRIKQRTASNFRANIQRRNNLSQGKNYVSHNKILTEPYEQANNDHSPRMITQQQAQQLYNSISQEVQQNIETVKKDIFTKISLYVKSLDEKGEQQLNEILLSKYKRHIKCHTDVILYQERIRQMIKTNKDIVKMLKQEFLSPRRVRQFSQRVVNVSCLNKEQKPKEEDNRLENNLSVDNEIQVIKLQTSSFIKDSINKQITSKNSTKHINMQNSHDMTHNDHIPNHLTQQSTPGQNQQAHYDFNQEMKHVTNQFINQWQKSKIHKKEIYQKFRKTLFKKFPQFRQRQRKRNKQLNIKPSQGEDIQDLDSQNDIVLKQNLFDSQIHLDGLKQELRAHKQNLKNSKQNNINLKINKQGKKQSKNIETKQSFNSQPKQIKLIQKSSITDKQEILPLKQTTTELSKSLSKITLLSKKNSISKASGRTLSILAIKDKKQIEKLNFTNLVEFIFKRAFFYSVSKKKVIQNKTPTIQLEIPSPIQKRKPDFSFINYNSKAEERRNLRISKLNQKKLRATGTFLIKNKFNIMEMQSQGNRSYDFLRKCLEDAIEDYLNVTKK